MVIDVQEGKLAAGPPGEVSAVAAQFIPEETPQIVAMDVAKRAVELTMETEIPAILVGHTGTAKTKVIQHLHHQAGWPYRAISGRESVEVDNLLGKWRIGADRKMEYHLGVLPFCMKHGIAVGIQEINYIVPEVLVLLHEYVDEGFVTLDELSPSDEDFIVKPHPNFRMYGTMNPPELYPGARELSPALLRRCMVHNVEALTKEQELAALRAQVPSVSEHDGQQMVEVAHSVRHEFMDSKITFYVSTADLIMWARLASVSDPITASELAVVGKAPERDQAFVRGRVRLSFSPTMVRAASIASEDPPF